MRTWARIGTRDQNAVVSQMSKVPGSCQSKFLALLSWLIKVSFPIWWHIISQDMAKWSFPVRTYFSSDKNTFQAQAFDLQSQLDCTAWEIFPKRLPEKYLYSSPTRSLHVLVRTYPMPNGMGCSANEQTPFFWKWNKYPFSKYCM